MLAAPVAILPVIKFSDEGSFEIDDQLAAEEPLEIRLEYGNAENRIIQNVSVTMRTPGDDVDLVIGFLFTEGIITNSQDIQTAQHCFIACAENKENVIQVNLREGVEPNLRNTERNFYTTSSCGVCGKASINAIHTVSKSMQFEDPNQIKAETLYKLPGQLAKHQEVFSNTGGIHASALFTSAGQLLLLKEDVGRHNALDKLIGAALKQHLLPLHNSVLLLSGRASFELVQKAVMAGINIIAAVGAPSTLAVQLANEFNVTLVGFLRNRRFNIYTSPHRIINTPI